jgi:hypothetical protein
VSSSFAFSTPLGDSSGDRWETGQRDKSTRHIEIVSSKEQRRARPRVVYAVIVVAGLFAIFMAQLLMSIVVADGAYRISGLQVEQRDLGRQQQSLSERLDLLASPQNLATQAESLGMVLGTSAPVFLRLSDGAIVGSESSISAGEAVLGANGSLVPNSLLGDIPLVTQAPVVPTTTTYAPASGTTVVDPTINPEGATTATGTTDDGTTLGTGTATQNASGAPSTTTTGGAVPSNSTTLPSPTTR